MFSQLFHSHKIHLFNPSGPFYRPKWQISLPFHIPEAWKRYPFRAETPRVGPYRASYGVPPGIIPQISSDMRIPGRETQHTLIIPLKTNRATNIFSRHHDKLNCYIAGNFFLTVRGLIGYFEVTCRLTTNWFLPNSLSRQHCKQSMTSEGNNAMLPANVDRRQPL